MNSSSGSDRASSLHGLATSDGVKLVEMSRTNCVGDEMIALMVEQGAGVSWSVCTLDGWMNDAADRAGVKLWKGMNPHPVNRMTVGAAWLRRDDRFEKRLIHAHDSKGRERLLSLFTLKPEFRPEVAA